MLASLLYGFSNSDLMAIWIANNEIAGPPGVRAKRAGDRDIVPDACAMEGFHFAHIKIAAREGGHRWCRRQDQGHGDIIPPQQSEVVPHRRKNVKPKMSSVERDRSPHVSYAKGSLKALEYDGLIHLSAQRTRFHQRAPEGSEGLVFCRPRLGCFRTLAKARKVVPHLLEILRFVSTAAGSLADNRCREEPLARKCGAEFYVLGKRAPPRERGLPMSFSRKR